METKDIIKNELEDFINELKKRASSKYCADKITKEYISTVEFYSTKDIEIWYVIARLQEILINNTCP